MFKKIVKKLDKYRSSRVDQIAEQIKIILLKEKNPILKNMLQMLQFLIVPLIYVTAIENFLLSPFRIKKISKAPNT